MNTEDMIITQLLTSEQYLRKVIPYIREDYFSAKENKVLFNTVKNFFNEYNTVPSKDAVDITISSRTDLNNDIVEKCVEFTARVKGPEENHAWIVDQTEQFCKDRALLNALRESIRISDDPKAVKGSIPQIMSDALAVSFDSD